ncbi:MAG: dihydroorotate dehydrogenase electron transfer subunit [Aquificota bacterium]|nr:dihydroorotate dehydrogenase electron transfer subunit [Aquificota bacterium]
MEDHLLEVKENIHLSGRTWVLRLSAPALAEKVRGGHFLMIEVSKSYDPMGRRAFAVGDVRGDEILIFYDVVGRGTEIMSGWVRGDRIRAFGPLGKGLFSYEGDKHLLVGGGIGLAGLTLFGKELRNMGKEVVFAYGARSAEHLSMMDWLKEEGFSYIVFTDDGSAGRKGPVTEILRDFDSSWVVSACGPKAMMREVKRISERTGHKVYLSLEARMACGWGVCLGCVVRTRDRRYRRVCWEGPVFPAEEVLI